MEQFGVPRKSDGEKTRVSCFHCGRLMRADGHQWEVDRFPVCGHAGGRYVRGNVVVSCKKCNSRRCAFRSKCREGAPSWY